MSTCRSCQAEIVWALTASGKRIPLDAEPVEIPRGLFRLQPEGGDVLALPVEQLRQSHFASCPNAAQHRKAG